MNKNIESTPELRKKLHEASENIRKFCESKGIPYNQSNNDMADKTTIIFIPKAQTKQEESEDDTIEASIHYMNQRKGH